MKRVQLTGALVLTLACGLTGCAGARTDDAQAGSGDRWKMMDPNGDGKISPGEHAEATARMFTTMDANADGKVTAEEMTAGHERVSGAKPGRSEMSAAEKIKVIDADGDGMLTAEEHRAGSRMMFERMDTDRDGFVSKGELDAGQAMKMRKDPQ
jgi:EF hand